VPHQDDELRQMFAVDPRIAGHVRACLDRAYASALDLARQHHGAVLTLATRLRELGALAPEEVAHLLSSAGART
jgi:hypothetical protein